MRSGKRAPHNEIHHMFNGQRTECLDDNFWFANLKLILGISRHVSKPRYIYDRFPGSWMGGHSCLPAKSRIVLKLAPSKGRINCFRPGAGSADADRRVSCVDESRVYSILRIPDKLTLLWKSASQERTHSGFSLVNPVSGLRPQLSRPRSERRRIFSKE